MFFAKYARAITDIKERKKLYSLFLTRNVFVVLFYVAIAALFISGIVLAQNDKPYPRELLSVVIFAFVSMLVLGVAALVIHIVFELKYAKILNRGEKSSEEPSIIEEYRKECYHARKSTIRKTLWALFVMIACIAVSFAILVYDSIKNPDSDAETPLFYVSVAIAVIGVLTFIFAYMYVKNKQFAESASANCDDKIKQIDILQGRKYKYRLQDDKAMANNKYLFPNKKLCAEVTDLRMKMSRSVMMALASSVALSAVVMVVFFSGLVFDVKLYGYMFPVFETIVFIAVLIPVLSYRKKIRRIENAQVEELKTNADYSKNLTLYNKHERYFKIKGKVLIYFYLLSILVGYVLAAIYPDDYYYSLMAIALLIVGLFLNSKFLTDFRKSVKPIEEEIDLIESQGAQDFSESSAVRTYAENAVISINSEDANDVD